MAMLSYVSIENPSEIFFLSYTSNVQPNRLSGNDEDNEWQLIDYAIDYPGLPVYPQSLIDWYQNPTLDSLLIG